MTTTLTMAAMRELAFARLEAELPAAVMLRHRIHADPQLGGDEIVTSDAIAGSLPTPVHRLAEGLWTRVGPDLGPAIGFRAELDALPINEVNGFSWRSVRRGVAHVCGHDVHTAALTAVTNALHGLDLQVAMVAAFQPREETIPSGAKVSSTILPSWPTTCARWSRCICSRSSLPVPFRRLGARSTPRPTTSRSSSMDGLRTALTRIYPVIRWWPRPPWCRRSSISFLAGSTR